MHRQMGKWVKFLIAPAGLFAMALFPRQAPAIVNGQLDGEQHPNVGQFAYPDGLDDDGDGIPDDRDHDGLPDVPASGGNITLIHPRVAIGAAHILEFVVQDLANGTDTRVSFSPQPRLHPETWVGVSAVILHPNYIPYVNGGGATPGVDVALVILSEPAVGVTPAPLAPLGFLDSLEGVGLLRDRDEGAPFTVVGYGDHGMPPNELLRRNGIRRVAVSEFMHLLEHWLFLDQNPAHGNAGSCFGDSGGPTFWTDPGTGEKTLVALVLNGDAACMATALNFRTDIPEVLDFVADVIQRVDAGEWD